MTWQTNSPNFETTEQLGQHLGKALRGGEVIELISDLGGGKTTLVRGLARGAGSQDKVASPTFTISKVYDCPKFQIHHLDFYRLAEAGIIADELAEVLGDHEAVVVIEWAEVVRRALPGKRLAITFEQTPTGTRNLKFHAAKGLEYLLAGIH